MSTETLNLGDIPDLSGIEESQPEPIANGWYTGTILAKREFTDKNGNDRVFESSDEVSARGDSRNIRLQVELKRTSDGRTLNTSAMINYQPEDLSKETVQAVAERNASGSKEWGELFRPFMTLSRLSKLQKIAGVRQLQRNGNGGLDLKPLFGKQAYFRLKDDDRNPQYKQVAEFREDKPAKSVVL